MAEGRIPAELVKRLRDETGAGMMDAKRALAEADGDVDKARELLRIKGQAGVEKRMGRAARQGVVEAYVHLEGRLGVLVEVNCETDFVARTPEFRSLAREIALQVAAMNPRWIGRDDVPQDVIDGERKIFLEQARGTGKPENVLDRIVAGKLEAFYREHVLMDQAYIRETSRSIADLVSEVAGKVGEKVMVRRFTRFVLGEE